MQRYESDEELMLRVGEEDPDSFASLMDRYRDRITGFFFSLCQDQALAEDLFQETFIRLWSARKRYRVEAKFSTYLVTIARNLWLNERPRWQWRMEARSLDEGVEEDRPDALVAAVRDMDGLPEEILMRKERQQQIRKAIEALPPPLALVFALSHLEGYRYREIAGMLGIAEGTVKWRMSEATARLRTTLADLEDR